MTDAALPVVVLPDGSAMTAPAVPELAAATRVWRDFFASPEEVYSEGYSYIRDCWEQA